MQLTRVLAGTLTHQPTPHRIGPPAASVMAEPRHPDLLLPVLSLDDSALGLSGAITFVTTLYSGADGGLVFARDRDGRLTLEDASSRALRQWHDEARGHGIAVEVSPAPRWRAPYLALHPFDVPGPDEHAYWSAQRSSFAEALELEPQYPGATLGAWRDAVTQSICPQVGIVGIGATLPLLLTPSPVWTQRDETPTTLGAPPRFIGQLRADRFTDDAVDCDVFLHLSADGRRASIANQFT